jgi:hypothetical protein
MRTRFQESKWYVKLWRLRHYVYIPFRWLWQLHLTLKSPINSRPFPGKNTWRLLQGDAQCDMNWTYTSEEVHEYINKNKDD